MKRLLFAILAFLIVATAALYAIFARDLTGGTRPPRRP